VGIDAAQQAVWLEHDRGRVSIHELPDGQRRVVTHPEPGVHVSLSECVTRYPIDLIEQILRVKSPSYLCDEIARDEDPNYVRLFLSYALLGYVPPEAFKGARILDFGSGSGASTAVLARLLPDAEIVGVELEPDYIAIARRRAQHYGLTNFVFHQSPDPTTVPDELGEFRYINLGAVYEHLLPDERRMLMPQLWARLEVGGVIFVNQLPHRLYPIEAHTTGLPLLNYLPDRLAHLAATRLSARIDRDTSWATLLRAGIRGGTARSVQRDLTRSGGSAELLEPKQMGLQDHADLWYGFSVQRRATPIKRAMRIAFKGLSRIAGQPIAPGLDIAFVKRS
jgi:SAM-dependent methyltransferase